MGRWDPKQYLKFENDRLRPAIELLGRVNITDPELVVDLGCGPATSTRLLGARFCDASVIGVDNSEAMLTKAKAKYPAAKYICGDALSWKWKDKADLIFANAVFHWLPDHPQLFENLAASLVDGGVLAFQMPDNMHEPSHTAIDVLLAQPKWRDVLQEAANSRQKLEDANCYYNWLAVDFENIDIWSCRYAHVMPDHKSIVEWVKGAALTPYLDLLRDAERDEFLSDYLSQISKAYPSQADGNVLYHFPRLFCVARKKA